MKDVKSLLLEIINNYGVEHQQTKLMEEVGELDRAITEYECLLRYEDLIDIDFGDYKDSLRSHIAEEIGDVLNVVEQFLYYYEIGFKDEVLEMKHNKINRQIERMKNE